MEELSTPTYCHLHPNVETALRCNKCGAYICAKCAVRTPTGYSCRSCINNQQKVFDNSNPLDGVLAVAVAGTLSFVGSLLVGVTGYFTIFLAPIAGIVIGEAVRFVTGKRRSQKMFKMVLIAVIIGALPLLAFNLIMALLSLSNALTTGLWSFLRVIWYGYYAAAVATSTYYRISGRTIRFRR
ncbi:MAG: hypothetical protein V2J07_12225 [Anaerolineae bacterium]|jgi:hypothetical protein|nr:hypothetical protein [Anaerolineae bacterium]